MSYFSYLECTACGAMYSQAQLIGTCSCGKVLFARYDLKAPKEKMSPDVFRRQTASLWRYKDILPVHDNRNIVTLGEGMTPLLPAARLGREIGIPRLIIKDEGINPTGSFKARGASVAYSNVQLRQRRCRLGVATYCRRGGLQALPIDFSGSTQKECAAVGSDIRLYEGHISRGAKLSAALAREHGWFEVNTMKEPYRVEGKKIMGYEIAEELG
jgi:threonine synthase